MKRGQHNHRQWQRVRPIAAALAAMLGSGIGGNALAFEIDTGNPDIEVRWDNTVRYNVAQRTQSRDSKIGNTSNFDEGTYSFDRGDLVSNRLDILSEFDFAYKKDLGFRVSAAGWYDAAYSDHAHTNPRLANIGSYVNNEYSGFTKRFYKGPSGEILDAFVFANFDAGNVPVKAKAGRHAVVWGESLFLGGNMHGVAYSQVPLDLQKGFATPGVEAKELFRPVNQVSAQAQLTDNFSVAGQYFLEWDPYRFPEGGTYLGPVDPLFFGPDRALAVRHPVLGNIGFTQQDEIKPDNSGEFGLSARWQVAEIDANLGFYYRNYADKIPQVLRTRLQAVAGNPLASGTHYRQVYADDIDLYGISFAKSIGGVSFGAEVSYRHNTPLNTPLLEPVETMVNARGLPDHGETYGARGNTMHALANVLGTLPQTPVFDAATWAAELTWASWRDVTDNERSFQAKGYSPACSPRTAANPRGYLGKSAERAGCVTDHFWGLALAFTPTWYQVFPGVDLSMPLTYSRGLHGNAPTIFGGNEDLGNYSVGLSADIFQKHRVDLKYYQYFGDTQSGTLTAAQGVAGSQGIIAQNGFTSVLKDRGFVSLTYKTTF